MPRVALIQLDLGSSGIDRPAPLGPVVTAVRTAARAGAQVVILPELWRTGPFELSATVTLAEDPDGPSTTALAAVAAETGIWLHAGSILTRSGGADTRARVYNTAYVFNPAGAVAAMYRKRHLFGFDTGEAALIDAGNDLVVVETPLGRTGLATCYDLRFPEHFRALVRAGAESILLTSGWPAQRIGHWDVLTAARAIENQVNLIACNATGRSGAVALGGHSVVYDPWGRALGTLDETPATLAVEIDTEAPRRTRAEFPVLRDRRD